MNIFLMTLFELIRFIAIGVLGFWIAYSFCKLVVDYAIEEFFERLSKGYFRGEIKTEDKK